MQPENSPLHDIQKSDSSASIVRFLLALVVVILILKLFLPPGQIHSLSGILIKWLILIILIIIPLSPIVSIIKTIGFILTGRLHFPKDKVGQDISDENGQKFTVFRQVVVDSGANQPTKPKALLTLKFMVKNMSPKTNKFYSLLPLMFYLGDPGFRSKTFTINNENCMSIYEWDTFEDAQRYLQSIALKTILLRSVTGSFSYSIRPVQ